MIACRAGASISYGSLPAEPGVDDEQILQSVPHPELGRLMTPEQPARFSDAPRGLSAAAPRLGEHTAEILGALAAANAESRAAAN